MLPGPKGCLLLPPPSQLMKGLFAGINFRGLLTVTLSVCLSGGHMNCGLQKGWTMRGILCNIRIETPWSSIFCEFTHSLNITFPNTFNSLLKELFLPNYLHQWNIITYTIQIVLSLKYHICFSLHSLAPSMSIAPFNIYFGIGIVCCTNVYSWAVTDHSLPKMHSSVPFDLLLQPRMEMERSL